MMESNWVVIKKEHIKTQTKNKDVLVIFILQETKNSVPIHLTKTVLKRTSNTIFNMKKVDLDES